MFAMNLSTARNDTNYYHQMLLGVQSLQSMQSFVALEAYLQSCWTDELYMWQICRQYVKSIHFISMLMTISSMSLKSMYIGAVYTIRFSGQRSTTSIDTVCKHLRTHNRGCRA